MRSEECSKPYFMFMGELFYDRGVLFILINKTNIAKLIYIEYINNSIFVQ